MSLKIKDRVEFVTEDRSTSGEGIITHIVDLGRELMVAIDSLAENVTYLIKQPKKDNDA